MLKKEKMVELEKVLNGMNVKSLYDLVKEIEDVCEVKDFGFSIYSNLYVYELLVEYCNEGGLYNYENSYSEYWLRKSLKYLRKFGIVIEELENLI